MTARRGSWRLAGIPAPTGVTWRAMSRSARVRWIVLVSAACSGGSQSRQGETLAREDAFGPLEIGADFASYRKVTEQPFRSLVHGNRWVDVFVNELGADAYLGDADIPVGAVIVKQSWQNDDGRISEVAGPIYVMAKREPGYAPDHDDWYYAIHWAAPPAEDARELGGPIYWRGHSPRVAYCWRCHDNYLRSLGGLVPSSLLPR